MTKQGLNFQNIQTAPTIQQQQQQQTNNPIKKLAEDISSYFSKEDIQMANKHKKNAQHCLLLLL